MMKQVSITRVIESLPSGVIAVFTPIRAILVILPGNSVFSSTLLATECWVGVSEMFMLSAITFGIDRDRWFQTRQSQTTCGVE